MATDDTDGHVDTLTRFFAPGAVVSARCEDDQHPDAAILEDNRRQLLEHGFEVVDLPHPEPVIDPEAREERLPATYANFLVLNGAVVIPVYGQPARDQRACGVLGELFPGRIVIPLDTREILREGGSFHCLSQQQPREISS
jgi:agmatine/peptidylarginine deiminase